MPDVVEVGPSVLVTEWLDSAASLASIIRDGTQEERDHYASCWCASCSSVPNRTGMLHADPHPGNFRVIPNEDGSPGRLGVLDYGAVARLPERRLPEAMGRLMRLCATGDGDQVLAGLRARASCATRSPSTPSCSWTTWPRWSSPPRSSGSGSRRTWMRAQFQRINDPKSPAYTVATRLNLPPSYLLIHRTWIGGIGVLSQLEAEAPFRAILEEYLPGFAEAE